MNGARAEGRRGSYHKEWAGRKLAACLESTALTRCMYSKCLMPIPQDRVASGQGKTLLSVGEGCRGSAGGKARQANGSAFVPPGHAPPTLVGVSIAGVWTEYVVRTVAPTSLRPKKGLCPHCACLHPPAVKPLASQMRGGRQNERKQKLLFGGRWAGR